MKIQPLLSDPLGLVLLSISISLSLLSTVQLSLVFLFFTFLLDFLTGIYASWIEFKEKKLKPKAYMIESVKLRKSVTKAISYMLFIGLTYGFEIIFFIKSFTISVSGAKLTITLIVVAVCIAIEFFSILENLKRSGYDVLGKINSTAKKMWNLFRTVKGETNEQ